MEKDKFPIYSSMEFVQDNAYPIEDSKIYAELSGVRSVEFAGSSKSQGRVVQTYQAGT